MPEDSRKVYEVEVRAAAEGGYWGSISELNSCYSQGETLEELAVNILEAVEEVLSVMSEDGQQVPGRFAVVLVLDGQRVYEFDCSLEDGAKSALVQGLSLPERKPAGTGNGSGC